MTNSLKIAPSILSADFAKLADECKSVQTHVQWFHVDVMDGHFVPNLTIGPCVVASLRQHLTEAFLDCHLMVSDPRRWITPMAKAGASQFCFHIEAVKDESEAKELCKLIREAGMIPAVSLKPNTPLSNIERLVSEKCVEYVLVMTVEPGYGGQSFLSEQMGKVRSLRELAPTMNIGVDGGIGRSTIKTAWDAGANCMVAGSAIFGKADRVGAIEELRALCV